jgi:predicted RNA-binding Zn-ribbon protein involved in translation (DUF1610 family)
MLDPDTTVSEFVCPDCGARERSVSVAYGPFGYAVCPDCGTSTRPTAALSREEWQWSDDVLAGTRD